MFVLDLGILQTKLADIVTKANLPCAFSIDNLETLRNLFTVYPKTVLLINGVSSFELDAEVRQKMGFCSRVAPKIQITIEKLRSKKFWLDVKVKALQAAVFPNAQSLTGGTKMLFQQARFKDDSDLLKPYLNLVTAKLLHKYTARSSSPTDTSSGCSVARSPTPWWLRTS